MNHLSQKNGTNCAQNPGGVSREAGTIASHLGQMDVALTTQELFFFFFLNLSFNQLTMCGNVIRKGKSRF